MQIETTRDSQALIASTGLSAVLDPEYRCNFKTVTGFVEIGAAQIIEIAKAVRAHVQACLTASWLCCVPLRPANTAMRC
nr:hypothetical protein [Pseudomonas sp. S11A4]